MSFSFEESSKDLVEGKEATTNNMGKSDLYNFTRDARPPGYGDKGVPRHILRLQLRTLLGSVAIHVAIGSIGIQWHRFRGSIGNIGSARKSSQQHESLRGFRAMPQRQCPASLCHEQDTCSIYAKRTCV